MRSITVGQPSPISGKKDRSKGKHALGGWVGDHLIEAAVTDAAIARVMQEQQGTDE